MNRSAPRRINTDALLLWLAAIAVLCAGYYIAFIALANAIDGRHELTARVSDTIRANTAIAAQRPALLRERQNVAQRMRGFDLRADRAALVARFVQTAARIAVQRQVSLDRVDARTAAAAAPASGGAPADAGSVPFEAIPLEVTLTGSYGGLLATIRALALAPLPMQLEIAAIERNALGPGDGTDTAPLVARLHLILQHFPDDAPADSAPHHTP